MLSVSAAALAAVVPAAGAMAANRSLTLRTKPTDVHLFGVDGPASQMMAYNGVFPGAEIRLQQGDRLTARQ